MRSMSSPFWCRPVAVSRSDMWALDIFSFVPRAPGLLISRSYGRVMPAPLRLTARDPAGTASPPAVALAFARGHRVPHSVTP